MKPCGRNFWGERRSASAIARSSENRNSACADILRLSVEYGMPVVSDSQRLDRRSLSSAIWTCCAIHSFKLFIRVIYILVRAIVNAKRLLI